MKDVNSRGKNRLFTVLVLLPTITALVVGGGFYQHLHFQFKQEQASYGLSVARLTASQLVQPIVDGDIVSLNVLTTRLTTNEPIEYVAVYDDNNRLLVQSGREHSDLDTYSAEITFQDSLVGFVNVAVSQVNLSADHAIGALLALALLYVIVIWRLLPGIIHWLSGNALKRPVSDNEPTIQGHEPISDGVIQQCFLVIRIRPARHLSTHFEKFYQAAKLYGGVVEQTANEEILIHFDGPDAMFMAACAGTLIRQIAQRVSNHITFGGTLDIVGDEPDKMRKAASYLASISEGDLLVAGGEELIADRVELQSFHHALIDSEDLVKITSLQHQALVNSQAEQLTGN